MFTIWRKRSKSVTSNEPTSKVNFYWSYIETRESFELYAKKSSTPFYLLTPYFPCVCLPVSSLYFHGKFVNIHKKQQLTKSLIERHFRCNVRPGIIRTNPTQPYSNFLASIWRSSHKALGCIYRRVRKTYFSIIDTYTRENANEGLLLRLISPNNTFSDEKFCTRV